MHNTIGNKMTLTLFGESHGTAIGCVLDGVPSGVKIDEEFIAHQMELRKAKGKISTARKEADEVKIVSGVFEGYTTGTPITILVMNQDQHSKDYSKTKDLPRPSHADYTANLRYEGYQDYRGGGHFSGRLTAPLVAAGAIAMTMLKEKNILIGSHILEINGIKDDSFNNTIEEIDVIKDEYFATLNVEAGLKMKEAIENARMNQDSLGGILETEVLNYPAGVGNPTFGAIESELGRTIFGIGAVKGLEFGEGFGFAKMSGSEANDSFDVIDGKVVTTSNHNGGINGGISNGMPIVFKTVIKPTPSISQKQKSFNMMTNETADLEIVGRHDPCIVHRARVVIDSVTAWILCDMLLEANGNAYFSRGRKECRED